ncbi:MAG: hypothetical protein P4L69_00750 [Desulfosporosinus sp.]|nr:hypothetical protein [Desulfosporosinus sp.]
MDEGEDISNPSIENKVALDGGQFVTMIDVDMTAYRHHKNSKTVKKTYPFHLGLMRKSKHIMSIF